MESVIRDRVHSNFPGLRSRIDVVSAERGQTEQHFLSPLQKHCADGYEGVIAKNPAKPYAIGASEADFAVKLKPDYFDGGLSDIDVIILGAKFSASYSRVGRAGDISTFLVGVRDERAHSTGEPPVEGWWNPVGSDGSGYSDHDLQEIRKQLKDHWVEFDAKILPSHFVHRNYPEAMFSDAVKWIPPSKSIVIAVRAYELLRERTALRFPRAERINWSKPIQEAITVQELEKVDDDKIPAIVGVDNKDGDDIGARKITGTGRGSARKVLKSACATDVHGVNVVCNVFENLTFYVTGGDGVRKEEIEVMIHELGGKSVPNLMDCVHYVIGLDPNHPILSRLLKRFKDDPSGSSVRPVVRPTWVKRCRKRGARDGFVWSDLYFAPPKMESQLLQFADRFGDP